jgi:hypothetical protein
MKKKYDIKKFKDYLRGQNPSQCPQGISKIKYLGTLGRKDMMVCPRKSSSSSGGNGGGNGS